MYSLITYIFLVLIPPITSFDFKQPQAIPTSYVTGETTTYQIYLLRNTNNSELNTAWDTTLVPNGSTITVTFPSDYTLSSPTCNTLIIYSGSSSSLTAYYPSSYTCTTSSYTVTIAGAITSAQYISYIYLILGSITNPVPAILTGSFSGSIGTDTAVANGGSGLQLTAATFTSCAVTFSPTYVNTTAAMIITVKPNNALDSTAAILVDVPSHWTNDIATSSLLPVTSSMSCANQTTNVNSAPVCTGYIVNYSILATSVLSSTVSTTLSFSISSMVSPPTLQPSDLISITSYKSGYILDTCSVYVSGLLALPFSSISINPISTMYINTYVGIQINMTLADTINQYDDIQVTFPSDIVPVYVNISGTASTYNSSSLTALVLTVIHKRTATKSYYKGAVYTLNFYKIMSLPSTKVGNPITVTILRNSYAKQTSTAYLPSAIATTLTAVAAPKSTTVGKVTSYSVNVTLPDPISTTGLIKIVFPSTIIPTLSSGCASAVGTNVATTPTCAFDSTTNTITLSALNSSSSAIAAQTIQFNISSVTNPPNILPSGTFTVTSYYTSDTTGITSTGTASAITATVDTISVTTVSVVPSSYVVSDTVVTYTISFTTGHSIPQGGYIEMTIPEGITLTIASVSSYCKIGLNSSSFVSTSCAGSALSSGYYINFTTPATSASIASGSVVSLRIQSLFTNPSDTSIISTFTLKTYSSNGYAIQQLTSGITVQMTTPSTMTYTNVTRSSVINSYANTSYTVRLRQVPALPSTYLLYVTFPSTVTLNNAITCTNLTTASVNCTVSSYTVTITMTTAVSSGSTFGVIIWGIVNSPSFAPLSTAFTFYTKSSNAVLSYATGSYTSNLANTVASSFSTLTYSYSPLIYGQATVLTVSLTPSSTVPSYLLITIASSFTVGTLTCPSSTCTLQSTNIVKLTGITSVSLLTFSISGITAPSALPTDYTAVSSYDSSSYKIDQSTSYIIFTPSCTMPCRTCSSTSLTSCNSCYSSTTISTYIYYYSSTLLCYTVCPSGTYTSSLSCIGCNSNCLTCSLVQTNCTACVTSSTYPYLYISSHTGVCRTACPSLYYPDTTVSPILCVLCISPCLTCTSQSVCSSCISTKYLYNSTCITTCPSSTTITNTNTNVCDLCSSQCATCSVNTTNCLTCSSSAALYNGSCVSTCPSPLVILNSACVSCYSHCLTCSLTYTNCTSCNSSTTYKYWHQYSCLSVCPQLYYADSANALCVLCSTLNIGCDNCTSTSTCATCNWIQGYVFLLNRCYSVTPTGYYNSSGYALVCDSTTYDCATCYGTSSNCTSCTSKYLYGTTCVSACPAGYVGISKVCLSCTSPCKTCTNLKTNCTSCLGTLSPSVYLSNYLCIQTCPDYTYPNASTYQCTSCVSPCELCTSATLCSSCETGYNLQGSTSCVVNCSFGYIGINRVCTRCTAPCDGCASSLTRCTSCLTGYLVQSTYKCVTTCPTGLYQNNSTGTCSGCTDPCVTCSTTISTCTSCNSSLYLYNYTCISQCPSLHYPLNNICYECPTNCSTCSSASVCLTCLYGWYLYSRQCIAACPSTYPVIVNSVCTACSDSSCLLCDYLDQCSNCSYPKLVLQGTCVSSCPTNYSSNGTYCIYNTSASQTNTTLTTTLSSTNIFPVPFSIAAAFIGIACIMSKFQHGYTFVSGALYGLWALLQIGAIGVGIYMYLLNNLSNITWSTNYIEVFIFGGAVAVMYLLNLVALLAQNIYLKKDTMFKKWQNRQPSNTYFYTFTNIVCLLLTHKFKNILFCSLFNFQIFKAKLSSPQNFQILNIFSFISFIPSAAILFSTSFFIYQHHTTDQQFMAYVDILVLTTACIVLAVFNSKKGPDFFQQKDQDGVVMHRRITGSDSILHEAIVPLVREQNQQTSGNMVIRGRNGAYNIKSMETISDSVSSPEPSEQYQYQQVKETANISVQAAPILQDYSKIHFYNDAEMSEMDMFQKVDKSVNNMTQNQHEISIQCENNIFEDRSVQQDIDVNDISLQNVPYIDEQGVQMKCEEDDQSIQCAVMVNNASIQYSAKPVFQNISQDFMESREVQNQDKSKFQSEQSQYEQQEQQEQENAYGKKQRPSQLPKVLKQQLQLDVDEKLRQRQQQLQKQRQLERQRQKQMMIKQFHLSQGKKVPKDEEVERNQADGINRIYNNDASRADGSSLMDSEANIIVHFNKNKKKEQQAQGQRARSAKTQKTQKQFLQMLQPQNPYPTTISPQHNQNVTNGQLDLESSMSFNVTRDLEQGNRKMRNVMYEQQDKMMQSQEDEGMDVNEIDRNGREVYILENQNNEEIPSGFQKSRSTNFKSSTKDGRRPPLPHNRNNRNMYEDDSQNIDNSMADEGYEEINHHPIRPMSKGVPRSQLNREQQFNFEPRTNLTHLVHSKKRNPMANHHFADQDEYYQSDDLPSNAKEIRQNPLPLPKIQKLKSQESKFSEDPSQRIYGGKRILADEGKLQFEDAERIDFKTEQDNDEFGNGNALPRVIKEPRLRKIRSQNKMTQMNSQFDNPVHRELLGKERFVDRTEKFLQKQMKKVQNSKKRIQMMQVMLERPNITKQRGYMKQTHSSLDKKTRSQLQKIYMNNPFDKRN